MRYYDAVAECRACSGKREISDEAARALCAAWQSFGSTGNCLAAVASGAWPPESLRDEYVDGDRRESERGRSFRDDLWCTFHGALPSSEGMIVYSALGTWSMHGEDE